MTVDIRRAHAGDVPFLVELFTDPEVAPFLAVIRESTPAGVDALVERSETDPEAFGLFVITVDGEQAGSFTFTRVNQRSRIGELSGLAVHPRFRGRRIADVAARLAQQHLFGVGGMHRLQMEIYGFNERAMRHAERAGFTREGVRRLAYDRDGQWVDGILYGVVVEDLDDPERDRPTTL